LYNHFIIHFFVPENLFLNCCSRSRFSCLLPQGRCVFPRLCGTGAGERKIWDYFFFLIFIIQIDLKIISETIVK